MILTQEDKVCTLQQAKRLVELKVVLDTEKVYVRNFLMLWSGPEHCEVDHDCLPAPDVAELGELLPTHIKKDGFTYNVITTRFTGSFSVTYSDTNNCLVIFNEKTEAQARCDCLIWLIENNYLEEE